MKTSQQQIQRWEKGQAVNLQWAVVLARVLGQKPEIIFPAFEKVKSTVAKTRTSKMDPEKIESELHKAGFETDAPTYWYR